MTEEVSFIMMKAGQVNELVGNATNEDDDDVTCEKNFDKDDSSTR